MSRRRQLSFDTLYFLGCLLCVFRTAFGDDTESNNSTSEDLTHAKRSFDFPTLFYPGPDNKFVTLSPPPELPDFVTIVVNGQKETFQRPKSEVVKPHRTDESALSELKPISNLQPVTTTSSSKLLLDAVVDRPDVDNVIVQHPVALQLRSNRFPEVSSKLSIAPSSPVTEGAKPRKEDNDEEAMMLVAMGEGQLFQRLPVNKNVRSRIPVQSQQRKSTHSDGVHQKGHSVPVINYRGESTRTMEPQHHDEVVDDTTMRSPIGRPPPPPSSPPSSHPPPLGIRQHYSVRPLYQDSDSEPNFRPPTSTTFSCAKLIPGYYADLETGCKMFHICHHGRKHTFNCPDETLFNQQLSVCDWSQRVTCHRRPLHL